MLTQQQADRLISAMKIAAKEEMFIWLNSQRQDELIVAVEDGKLQFVLSMKRSPYEIRLHLRTRDRNIGLIRLDDAAYHPNPDGTEIRNQPHLHLYREGYELAFAEPVDWYDATNPIQTFERFLDAIKTNFPSGYQLELI